MRIISWECHAWLQTAVKAEKAFLSASNWQAAALRHPVQRLVKTLRRRFWQVQVARSSEASG